MQINSTIEKPTRNASARAMLPDFALLPLPPLSMKKSADPRLARMAKNAIATR